LLHVLAVFPELPDADDWVVIEEGAALTVCLLLLL
jgi:hypothetical protein